MKNTEQYKETLFGVGTKRRNYEKSSIGLPVFDLLAIQKDFFNIFITQGIKEIFEDIYPVISTNNKWKIIYVSHSLDVLEKEGDEDERVASTKLKGSNYYGVLKAKFQLENISTGEIIQEDESFIANLPLMTSGGSFIINGTERVIISQIVRSPGIYFENMKTARAQSTSHSAVFKVSTLIPARGSWIELDYKDYKLLGEEAGDVKLRIDKSKKLKMALLLYGLGLDDAQIKDIYQEHDLVVQSMLKIPSIQKNPFEARKQIFSTINPGDRSTNAAVNAAISNLLFNGKRMDLSKTGRFKINSKLSPRNRIIGKILAEDVVKESGAVILKKGQLVNLENTDKIMKAWEDNSLKMTNLTVDPIFFEEKGYLENLNETEKKIFSQVHIIKILEEDKEGKKRVLNVMANTNTTYRHLTISDLLTTIGYILNLEEGLFKYDDIDSLQNRKIQTINDLLKNQLRIGLTRIEKNMKDRMATKIEENVTIKSITNHKLMETVIKDFFNSSQLSQFMDQVNPLAEISNKRRITSLGPGGLSRDTASLVVRGIHDTHYGRIDPIETPEGPNIGLILNLAIYARVNEYGLIETPFYEVTKGVVNSNPKKIKWLMADDEIGHFIAPATTRLDGNVIIEKKLIIRNQGNFEERTRNEVTLINVSPKQIVSLATSHIPFLENNDANRALMGANMQRQSVPLIQSDSPIVATGIEQESAKYSPTTLTAREAGVVTFVSSEKIKISEKDKEKTYKLEKFTRSNQGSSINQIPVVKENQKIKKGQIIADGPSVNDGELAIGKNVLVAFSTWRGYNYEDAIIVSERLVKDDVFTSIHIEEHTAQQRTTKLGSEQITNEIPNASLISMRNLGSDGIIIPGSQVKFGDVLVGKVTPKGDDEQSPEDQLLNAILGKKTKGIRDTSLRVQNGAEGTVQRVEILSREGGDRLDDGVEKIVKVYIAKKRKLKEGDKMSGRHGNKGVVSIVLPIEDMPHLDDGTPIDIMLNPLGVPSRMNVGQVLELHLGMAAKILGLKVSTPIFNGVNNKDLKNILKEAKMPLTGKYYLHDGITGEKYDEPVAVGIMYMLKLSHMIDDKMHARSIGPYSLITQQPLRGKSQNGGQRFGEMEGWAIEAYGASNILQEMLTVKSDDIKGRSETYNAIARGYGRRRMPSSNIPEGFWVLFYELRGLGLRLRFRDIKGEILEIDNKL